MQCESFKESSVAELLSALAAGWNAKLIVEAWSYGGPIATSIGLAVAARHTCGRHVCVVPDERSRLAYVKGMNESAGISATEVIVREAEEAMAELVGVDFLVVDYKRKDFVRVLRFAKVSNNGAVLVCKNACQGNNISGLRWNAVLERGTRVVRSVFLPVGQGLEMAHVGSKVKGEKNLKNSPTRSRWIKHIDQRSGEEHVFRGNFMPR